MSGTSAVFRQFLGLAVSSVCIFSANCVTAQITPDRTLPNNSSVTINGSTFNITGGTQAGRNLFHSFQQFSVPTGGTASFNNALDIQNIFSRVTGGTISNIDGIIKANGTANIFFLNPSGIVFGKNASLNVGGSFVATTANAIQFGNFGTFSASEPNNPALLTVNPTALFYNQITAGTSIQNNSQASVNGNLTGLQVPDRKSLLLVGGNVTLDGGRLTAYGGRLELASLAAPGTIGLNVAGDTLSLNVPSNMQGGNIYLRNRAFVDVTGAGGGDIAVNASKFEMSNFSYLQTGVPEGVGNSSTKTGDININADSVSLFDGAQIDNLIYGKGIAGAINLNVGNALTISGKDSAILAILGNGAVGRSGDISIQAKEIVVENTFTGDGIASATFRQSLGDAGDITINTKNLIVRNSQLGSLVFGEGNTGTFKVIASDSVELSGEIPGNDNGFPGGILAQVDVTGKGKGGILDLETKRLNVSDGSKVQTATFGEGDAGSLFIRANEINVFNTREPYYTTGIFATVGTDPRTVKLPKGNGGDLTIETKKLSVRSGGNVAVYTEGEGNAGKLFIRASDSVEVTGNSPSKSIISAEVRRNGIGNGGSIKIETPLLSVTDGGIISTSSQGVGTGGDLNIQTRFVSLNQGQITSQTVSGNGGNITFNLSDYILLRNGSQISTNAGTASSGGNGGNITINTPFVIGFPLENTDITANAFSGSGGRVSINATNLFNIASLSRQDLERLRRQDLNPRQLPTNDITAVSQQNANLNGIVQINTPDIDPGRTLVTLPTVNENPPKLVSSNCRAFNEYAGGNNFTITGRGGLPPSPYEPLTSDAIWTDTRLPQTTAHQNQPNKHVAKIKPKPIEIVPATGWVFNSKGEVTLISSVSNATSSTTPTSCGAR